MQFSCREVVEMYEDGLQGLRETFDMAADAAAQGDVESNLRTLPLMWRKDVELYIFSLYDNAIDSDDSSTSGLMSPISISDERTSRRCGPGSRRRR